MKPDIVPDGRQREVWAISSFLWIAIDVRDGGRRAIRAAQAIQADEEEPRCIEGFTLATDEGAPPVSAVGTAGEGMADHEGIVSFGVEGAFGRVGDGDIVEDVAGFEGEGGDDGDSLVGDQA